MFVKTETERLLIRDLIVNDIPFLLRQKIEPTARPNILWQKSEFVYDREDLETAIAWSMYPSQREYYQLLVQRKSDGRFIGTCSLFGVFPDRIAGMGWHYQSEFAGRGYATEAARELLYLGFEINRVAMIYAECFAANRGSARIMEKLGMSPDYSCGDVYNLNGNGERMPALRHFIRRQEWITRQT